MYNEFDLPVNDPTDKSSDRLPVTTIGHVRAEKRWVVLNAAVRVVNITINMLTIDAFNPINLNILINKIKGLSFTRQLPNTRELKWVSSLPTWQQRKTSKKVGECASFIRRRA